MKLTIPLFALAVVLCGCKTPRQDVYDEDQTAFFRTKAEHCVQEACTNTVPNLKQITELNVDDTSKNVNKWTANATIEYNSKTNGVVQETVGYVFLNTGDDLYCVRKY